MTWEAKEEDDSSTALSMQMFRCVWEENLKTTRNPAAAKAKSTKEKEAEAAIKKKWRIVSWTIWRAEVKNYLNVLLKEKIRTQKKKGSHLHHSSKKHEVYALKWKNRRIGNRTRRLQMGRNSTEWNVETWTGRAMGDTSQPHFHRCWEIREQTRSWNHAEQKVEKRIIDTDYINERAIKTTILVNRRRIDLMSVCFPHTRNIRTTTSKRCTKLSRNTCQTTKSASLSLVVISTLSWDLVKDRNVKVLASTPSTKATKEVIGWKVGWC